MVSLDYVLQREPWRQDVATFLVHVLVGRPELTLHHVIEKDLGVVVELPVALFEVMAGVLAHKAAILLLVGELAFRWTCVLRQTN